MDDANPDVTLDPAYTARHVAPTPLGKRHESSASNSRPRTGLVK